MEGSPHNPRFSRMHIIFAKGNRMEEIKSASSAAEKNVLRITVERNIRSDFCIELEKRFQAEMQNADGPVVLDLTRVSFIDSRGVALCVALFKECQQKKLAFSIEVSPELARFLNLLKLDRVFPITQKRTA